MGFLYCRREWAERLRPAYLAREGVELASARAFQRREGEYALGAGTGRFQIGHLNYVASTAVRTSLDYLLEIGATAIEAHVSGLANRLAAGLIELGLGVASGQPGPHFGHLVCVGTPGFGDSQLSTGDEALDRLARFLEARDVVFSIRNGQLRFALHLYNTEADVERVLVLTREQLG